MAMKDMSKTPKYELLCMYARDAKESGYDEYYFETGRYKPWTKATLKAAERRGLVASYTGCGPVYMVKLTEEGYALGEKVSKKIFG
jgi:hypothetical protein